MYKLAIRGGTPSKTKPFPKWPVHDKEDEENLLKALKSGCWGKGSNGNLMNDSGEESFIKQFEKRMAEKLGVEYALAVSSGTCALEIAIRSLDIGVGDEVIVTPYSYIASATCILQSGGIPVFPDIDPKRWNMDLLSLKKMITPKTKGIVVVHFAGQAVDMDQIMTVAKEHNLVVIEDVAHGFGGEWNGQPLGTFGDLSCFSFQESKNLTCGEGGMIVTNNRLLFEKAYSYHVTGRHMKGKWYEHFNLGWNARMTEFQAAIACSQLSKFDDQHKIRKANAAFLKEHLNQIDGIEVSAVESKITEHPYHIFTLRYDSKKWSDLSRNRLIRALNCEGIPCHCGYLYPIYKNPLFVNGLEYDYAKYAEICTNAEKICNEAIWIPQMVLLGDFEDMKEIIDAFHKIKSNLNELGVSV